MMCVVMQQLLFILKTLIVFSELPHLLKTATGTLDIMQCFQNYFS